MRAVLLEGEAGEQAGVTMLVTKMVGNGKVVGAVAVEDGCCLESNEYPLDCLCTRNLSVWLMTCLLPTPCAAPPSSLLLQRAMSLSSLPLSAGSERIGCLFGLGAK